MSITTFEQAQAQQATYRKTCSARRSGRFIETREPDGSWASSGTVYPTINKAKAACRGGTYNGVKVYAL